MLVIFGDVAGVSPPRQRRQRRQLSAVKGTEACQVRPGHWHFLVELSPWSAEF